MEVFEAFLAGSPISHETSRGSGTTAVQIQNLNRTPHRLDCDHFPSNGDDIEDIPYLALYATCLHIVEPLGDILGIRSNSRSTSIP